MIKQTYMHICMHTYMHTNMHTFTDTHAYTYMQIYMGMRSTVVLEFMPLTFLLCAYVQVELCKRDRSTSEQQSPNFLHSPDLPSTVRIVREKVVQPSNVYLAMRLFPLSLFCHMLFM